MKIYTEFILATGPKMVKFRELNNKQILIFEF